MTIWGQQIINDKKSNEIAELGQQNIKLSEENADLAIQSLKYITGGESWAYLSGGVRSSKGILNQPFGLSLIHVGDNPLHDLIVDIFEVEELTQKSHTRKKVFHKEIGTVSKSVYSEPLVILELPNKQRVDYIVILKARNGEIMQHWIFIKKADNYWSTAMKVYKFTPNKDGVFSKVVLREQVDDDFPDADLIWIGY